MDSVHFRDLRKWLLFTADRVLLLFVRVVVVRRGDVTGFLETCWIMHVRSLADPDL